MGTVLFVVLYVGHKVIMCRSQPWLIPAGDIDLSYGVVVQSVHVEAEAGNKNSMWTLGRSKS